jgi:hypothetical protein
MFFKDYLNSTANCLEARLEAYNQQQHTGDIGELCEIFVKDFLLDSFSGILRVFRGGQIINVDNNKSKQIDIVLCSQSSLKLFSDKGLYPIETVYGAINIKKVLTHTNLFSTEAKDCGAIENLQSIPKDKINLHIGLIDKDRALEIFSRRFPYKIIFAFGGKILQSWEDELNELAKQKEVLQTLPDLIIVNKQGMIKKSHDGKMTLDTGETRDKYFHFSSFEENKMFQVPFLNILHELYKNAGWQHFLVPAYEEYFNKDLN